MPSSSPQRHLIPDPGPIGLAAFAATTMMLSVFNAGLMDKELEAVVFPVAFIYGGIVQLIAGVLEMFRKNIFGAVAFLSYGAFWIALDGIVQIKDAEGKGLPGEAIGLFLLAFTIFTAYMTIVTLRTSVGLCATFIMLTFTFILLTAGAFSGTAAITQFGGICGLVTAALAWYCSFAGIINTTWGRTVLPNRSLAR